MTAWLVANAGTIIVCVLVVALVVLIVSVMRKDKKAGKSAFCSENCASCPGHCGSMPEGSKPSCAAFQEQKNPEHTKK